MFQRKLLKWRIDVKSTYLYDYTFLNASFYNKKNNHINFTGNGMCVVTIFIIKVEIDSSWGRYD